MVNIFNNKKILVTGHTGFKGSWLGLLLLELGGKVTGYSLDLPSQPNLFTESGLATRLNHTCGDVRDLGSLSKVFKEMEPDIVFHLAAQPLVRPSYEKPKETFDTNVGGTVNLLECVRQTPSVRMVINVTTDKCYENRESPEGYRETDPLGGHDPYSASKAASEIVTQAYQKSFFPGETIANHRVGVATARSGNVIGGGDWGEERIIPDSVRALAGKKIIAIRNPDSVRPWQHVLECLSGYLCLATQMTLHPAAYVGAWNFGPADTAHVSVREVVEKFLRCWGSGTWEPVPKKEESKVETKCLTLDCEKALKNLAWSPIWGLEKAIQETADWYQRYYEKPSRAFDLCHRQIHSYMEEARRRKIAWA